MANTIYEPTDRCIYNARSVYASRSFMSFLGSVDAYLLRVPGFRIQNVMGNWVTDDKIWCHRLLRSTQLWPKNASVPTEFVAKRRLKIAMMFVCVFTDFASNFENKPFSIRKVFLLPDLELAEMLVIFWLFILKITEES